MIMAKLNVRFHPQGHIVYILEGADGSYFTGMCSSMKEELKRIANGKIRHFKKPERFPVTVVFKEDHLPFQEALLKFKYLRSMNRLLRKKLIDTKKWPAGKMLEPLILEKMKKYLEEEALR